MGLLLFSKHAFYDRGWVLRYQSLLLRSLIEGFDLLDSCVAADNSVNPYAINPVRSRPKSTLNFMVIISELQVTLVKPYQSYKGWGSA